MDSRRGNARLRPVYTADARRSAGPISKPKAPSQELGTSSDSDDDSDIESVALLPRRISHGADSSHASAYSTRHEGISHGEIQANLIVDAIFRVVAPVILCMALSACLPYMIGDFSCWNTRVNWRVYRPYSLNYFLYRDAKSAEQIQAEIDKLQRIYAIIFVCSFMVFVVIFTFLIACLYKHRFGNFIRAWMVLSVLLVLGYQGGLYLYTVIWSRCWSMDWLTFVIIVYNFLVAGAIAIFWKAPRSVNQFYLIALSAIMSMSFRALHPIATWLLMLALVVWDLFAVLSPMGPLRWLVETAKERSEALPALVYDTDPRDEGRHFQVQSLDDGRSDVDYSTSASSSALSSKNNANARASRPSKKGYYAIPMDEPAQAPLSAPGTSQIPLPQEPPENKGRETQSSQRNRQDDNHSATLGFLDSHLKLGLGDFVFYSVLVSSSIRDGGIFPLIFCFVAVIGGLIVTLVLLIIFRQPLPALPISLTLGILAYVSATRMVQPMIHFLAQELLFS